jgi:hypothetical protein
MRRVCLFLCLATILIASAPEASAQPAFVNGLVIPGEKLDATHEPGANGGRLGFFSDIYYDPARAEWWAISDRGPGGGTLDYATRVQRFTLDVNPITGAISHFKVKATIRFTDPKGLLSAPTNPSVGSPSALNGLNPLVLNGDAGVLGRSLDPEGLAIDPRTGHLIVADEYGPVVYEFSRKGRLLRVFQTPANLVPKAGSVPNYVATRDDVLTAGRQDNRGFEGIAISPDGKKLYAVLQDPLLNEGPHTAAQPDNNGRNGRNIRIVVFDNDWFSPTYGTSTEQYAYQLEAQSDVAGRIIAAGGSASDTDPRQGRNIGLSSIIALNDHEFLVLERDNRGIGVDDPKGANVVGSKRIYKIDIDGATNVASLDLPDDGDLPLAGIVPVTKSATFIDLALNSLLPNGKRAEKWEGMTIGPRLWNGAHLVLVGNDNDYSVTQIPGSSEQLDVYVDFAGNFAKCPINETTLCQINDVGPFTEPLPSGHSLLPGMLHAYRASAHDLAGYVKPKTFRSRFGRHPWFDGDDCEDQ